jgi:hypothetical protein
MAGMRFMAKPDKEDCPPYRSAELHSAVSPTCSRQGEQNHETRENYENVVFSLSLRSETPRYSRVKLCATSHGNARMALDKVDLRPDECRLTTN